VIFAEVSSAGGAPVCFEYAGVLIVSLAALAARYVDPIKTLRYE
jgi:hypothetical protein